MILQSILLSSILYSPPVKPPENSFENLNQKEDTVFLTFKHLKSSKIMSYSKDFDISFKDLLTLQSYITEFKDKYPGTSDTIDNIDKIIVINKNFRLPFKEINPLVAYIMSEEEMDGVYDEDTNELVLKWNVDDIEMKVFHELAHALDKDFSSTKIFTEAFEFDKQNFDKILLAYANNEYARYKSDLQKAMNGDKDYKDDIGYIKGCLAEYQSIYGDRLDEKMEYIPDFKSEDFEQLEYFFDDSAEAFSGAVTANLNPKEKLSKRFIQYFPSVTKLVDGHLTNYNSKFVSR